METSTRPTVSVVTATRNRASLLERALGSIAAQTHPNYEVIVVDDGSEAAVWKEYDRLWAGLNGRFRLEKAPMPGARGTGPAAARNRGIRAARGEFVAFLDDDDWWVLPDHLAVGTAALDRCGADYYFANMQTVLHGRLNDGDLWLPDTPRLTGGPLVAADPPVYEVSLERLVGVMKHHLVHPNQSIIRRSLLDDLGGFIDRLTVGEDINLMLRVADGARRILYRPQVAVHYRFPEGNSVSLTQTKVDTTLQFLFAAQHARATCQNRGVRRCARSREAWSLRDLSRHLAELGRPREATAFAWQALTTYPTLGSASHLLRTGWRALSQPAERAGFRDRGIPVHNAEKRSGALT